MSASSSSLPLLCFSLPVRLPACLSPSSSGPAASDLQLVLDGRGPHHRQARLDPLGHRPHALLAIAQRRARPLPVREPRAELRLTQLPHERQTGPSPVIGQLAAPPPSRPACCLCVHPSLTSFSASMSVRSPSSAKTRRCSSMSSRLHDRHDDALHHTAQRHTATPHHQPPTRHQLGRQAAASLAGVATELHVWLEACLWPACLPG